jgi:hypothetical protein
MKRWKVVVLLAVVVVGLAALGNAVASPPWPTRPAIVRTWCANTHRVRQLQAEHKYAQAVAEWKAGHSCTRGAR